MHQDKQPPVNRFRGVHRDLHARQQGQARVPRRRFDQGPQGGPLAHLGRAEPGQVRNSRKPEQAPRRQQGAFHAGNPNLHQAPR